MYLVGIAGHLIPATLPLMIALTPFTLWGNGVYLAYLELRGAGMGPVIWAAVSFGVTFLLEALSVATGLVFGWYQYGGVLGFQIAGVPLVIGLNWVLIILGAIALCGRFTQGPWLTALCTGAIALGFDYLLEPAAIGLGYWQWAGGAIPVQNYIAWFCIAAASGFTFRWFKLQVPGTYAAYYLGLQTVFFAVLRAGMGM